MTILNFTQHPATAEQLAQGVINLGLHHDLVYLKELLTFTGLPSPDEVYERAYKISELAQGMFAEKVMIGGAPFLMPYLQAALQKRGITVLYALFVPEQSVYKMIEVRCFDTMLDVQIELFSHDDEVTFEILHAAKDGVDVLNIIERLGGLSKLSEAVEQALKGGE